MELQLYIQPIELLVTENGSIESEISPVFYMTHCYTKTCAAHTHTHTHTHTNTHTEHVCVFELVVNLYRSHNHTHV